MPTFDLRPHPASPPTYADRLEAKVERTGLCEVALRFRLFGDLNLLHLAPPKRRTERLRRNELWRTTCFECFCLPAGGEQYVEMNLAPNGDWAAYQFAGRRIGMIAANVTTDDFRVKSLIGGVEVAASFSLPDLSSGNWLLGLSAVVEGVNGAKSYWALAHAPGPPDFHNPTCFTARLPAPGAP